MELTIRIGPAVRIPTRRAVCQHAGSPVHRLNIIPSGQAVGMLACNLPLGDVVSITYVTETRSGTNQVDEFWGLPDCQ